MRKIILFLTIISLLLITFSCGGGSSQGVSPVTVSASFKSTTAALMTAASTLTTIRYTVSGSGMETMPGTVPVTGNLVEFVLDVPNGPQRRFLIEALDIDNKVKYAGEAYRDLDGTPITIEIVLVSTTSNPMFGKWGHVGLTHENSGQWISIAETLIFNADGTGTETKKYNEGGILTSETENFTYSITPNQDGSFTLTMVYSDGNETHKIHKIIFSDDGKMVISDGTTDTTEQSLDIVIKMDTSKTYTNADWIGENYIIAYEYDTLSQPSYDALSGIALADGNGNLSGTNTVNSNGTLKTETYTQTYSVSPDGSSADGSGFASGDVKLFISSSATDPTEWRLLFGMKKGDKTYSTADLAGTWAWVGFGDDYGTSFNADFGTMTCDSSGNCVRSSKNQMDGNIQYESSTIKVSVSPDGSFGASLAAGAPSYAGAIGNNGNSFVVNASFDQSNLKSREIIIGVRCSTCSNLIGQIIFVELVPSFGLYALGTQLQPTVDTLVSTPTLSDNIYNVPATISTDTINIGQNGNQFNNIGIQLFSSEKPVDTLFIYVNKDVTSDTILTNPTNWKVYGSDFNLPATWTEMTIQSVTVSAFDVLDNIYRYAIKFSTPQNALYFRAINMDNANINDVLVTEIEAFGTDVVPYPQNQYSLVISGTVCNTNLNIQEEKDSSDVTAVRLDANDVRIRVPYNSDTVGFDMRIPFEISSETTFDLSTSEEFDFSLVGNFLTSCYGYPEWPAQSGFVTITKFNSSGLTGTYDVYIDGNRVAGLFNVSLTQNEIEMDVRIVSVSHTHPTGDIGELWLIDLVMSDCDGEPESWGDDYALVSFEGIPLNNPSFDYRLYITNYRVTYTPLSPTYPPIDEIRAGTQSSYEIIPNAESNAYPFLIFDFGRKFEIQDFISRGVYPPNFPLLYNMTLEMCGQDSYGTGFCVSSIIRVIEVANYDYCL